MFEIEGTDLLTDETTANIVYVADVTQEAGGAGFNRMDPLLVKAVATMLAAKLAWPLQQSRTLQESLLQEAEADIRKGATAGARDAFEPLVNQASESTWISARNVGTGA